MHQPYTRLTTSASLCEGPIFYFMFLLYVWVKVIFTFPFFILSFGKLFVFEISWYIYIELDVSWHRLSLLTSPKGEYVGRQNYKPQSFFVFGWSFEPISIAWVLATMKDKMIVEYLDLLKNSLIDSFRCYDKLQLLQWLRL